MKRLAIKKGEVINMLEEYKNTPFSLEIINI